MAIIDISGQEVEYEEGSSYFDIALGLDASQARSFASVESGSEILDLRDAPNNASQARFLSFGDEGGAMAFWHTTSHLMAQAVKRLYPDAKLAIGPAIASGFYYDFDISEQLTPESLDEIEAEMKKIIRENPRIERFFLSRDEALKKMQELGEPYKVELISDIAHDEAISFYSQGEFTDLCAGPHLLSFSAIKAFKLTSIAGAYWRGDESNKMLQRIYGISFPTKEALAEHLGQLEEARKRDHRKLGREMDLFSLHDEAPGFPFFHPKGLAIRNELEAYWREEHKKRGYEEVRTPIILDADLWRRSGHWDHYKDNMYFTEIDEKEFAIKPMNCPGSMLLFKRKLHSYRDLPLRYAEMGLVHRHEKSGALHGLMRVRCFTQDDAHIFISHSQILEEVSSIIGFIDDVYSLFGFSYHVELSTRPESSMGSDEQWEEATESLRQALDHVGLDYKINEGDGAFYGPKIDFHLRDSLGRTWQCGTVQLDFQMPELFDCTYIGPDGEKARPCVVHRVLYGSIERFIAILIEHYAGEFPLWLAPVQAVFMTVSEEYAEYARKAMAEFESLGIRCELDTRNEKLGYKIREAELSKAPYMIVIGSKEMESEAVSIRSKKRGDLGQHSPQEAAQMLSEEIKSKSIPE
ncbi:MAG: threonine--tRNA ligase [Eubacteriaceae bacterium]|nr:threonine--tRNA ligase [Eubacteriaceae bacterium]